MAAIVHEEYPVASDDYLGAGKVSRRIKEMLKQMGFSPDVSRRAAVACYEGEINLVIHSDGGKVILEVSDTGDISLVFADTGPGIEDVEKAMTPGFSTASEEARRQGFGAGMGLPNIKRVSDTFDLKSGPEGTILSLTFKGGI